MQTRIEKYLDAHKEELYSLLSSLIQIDTQNFTTHGNEEAGQRFLLSYCRRHGLETDLYYPDKLPGFTDHAGYLAGRGTDTRPNVTAVLRGRAGGRKIMLAAHMDTMPVGEEGDWSVPPLGGVIKDGKIFGRGVSDDKFGIAAAIFAVRAVKECGIQLSDDVYITSYCDEEMGGGNGALAACLCYPSDVYINLDGGGMEVQPYAVGGRNVSAFLHKEATLSSCTAVFEGLKVLVEEMEAFGRRRFAELRENPVFSGTPMEKDAYRLLYASSGNMGVDLNSAGINFSYYTLLEQPVIEAELAKVEERISEKLRAMGLVFDGFQNVSRFFHPVYPAKVSEEAALFRMLLEKTYQKSVPLAGSCLSDLSVFYKYGGGIAFNTGIYKAFDVYGGAHQIDEHADCDEVLAITKALALYLTEKSYKGA